MRKSKLITGLISPIVALAIAAPVYASVLSIQNLPGYINSNSFKLSCTSSGGPVQFSVSKHGGAFTNFGPVIDTSTSPCVVQVTASEVNDQTDYTFSVNGGPTTSTFYDASGPSPISGFYKERPSDGSYKLHWRNPGDSDFDKVVIYRGDAQGFSADSGHEIARVSGGSNSDMTYEDNFTPDSGKVYFYALRALDHAGNSSNLAGDAGVTTQVLGTSTIPAGTGKVTVLPKETGSGTVLGTETVPGATTTPIASDESLNTKPGVMKWILTHKKISGGIAIVLLAVAYYLFRSSKKNK